MKENAVSGFGLQRKEDMGKWLQGFEFKRTSVFGLRYSLPQLPAATSKKLEKMDTTKTRKYDWNSACCQTLGEISFFLFLILT